MTRIPRDPTPGEGLSVTWARQLLKYLRESRLVAGAGIRMSCGPHGTVIDSTATAAKAGAAAAAQYHPFAVRYHTTDNDSDGQWEVRIPYGSVSVGSRCDPINKAASSKGGHENEDGWYALYINESEGAAGTRQEGSGQQAVTVSYRRWAITAHCKTSAKVTGVDGLDAAARRLVYFSADKIREGSETISDENLAKNVWGDEFSASVGTVWVEERQGVKSRRFEWNGQMAISVAGRERMNFDLVWYLSLDENGQMQVDNVYCIRQNLSVAGMEVVGDTMTDVSAAKGGDSTIYAVIRTNAGMTQNAVDVVVDPQNMQEDDYTTWLHLYDLSETGMIADCRASSLANIQVYR